MVAKVSPSLTVTVGSAADNTFVGNDHLPLQAAVDYVSQLGGGIVQLRPQIYELRNAVHLRAGTRIIGAGDDTVLRKPASRSTPLIDDMDWFDWWVAVEDASCFEVGGGILLHSQDNTGGRHATITKHTVLAIEGQRLRLDSQPRKNHWTTHDAKAKTLFPLLTGNWVSDLTIRDLALDGNAEQTELLDGNYGGCIFLQDCHRVQIDNVTARNNHGDGISWQVCNDVTVTNCRSAGHTGLGLHPGSGSQRPVMRGNQISDCQIGLFWCWGVRHGIAEDNEIRNCGCGISIGHHDTDNAMRNNRVYDSTQAALRFRDDQPAARAAHRNLIEHNLFSGAGTAAAPGVGIDVAGPVTDVVLRGNRIVNPAGGYLETGIRIAAGAQVELDGNSFDNVAAEVVND